MGTKSHCVERDYRGCRHESSSLRHLGSSEDAVLYSDRNYLHKRMMLVKLEQEIVREREGDRSIYNQPRPAFPGGE